MSVIINELEVTAVPDAAPEPPPGPRVRPAEPAGPTPLDLRAVLSHLAERADRVRAD